MSETPSSSIIPIDLRREGESIVIQWDNDTEDHWTPFQLRAECPCATCREKQRGDEERKIVDSEKKRPMLPVLSAAEAQPLRVVSMRPVGNYGYNISFSDGHHSGIFTFDRLARRLATKSLDTFPKTGRLACIDFGTVRIGIAICDPNRILASPHAIREGTNWREDGDYYRRLAKEERIGGWVVGLPIHLDGNESEKSQLARVFGSWLCEETSLPVRMFDERFTTVDANARIRTSGWTRDKKKKRIDAIAATVLLEAFLEAGRYRAETPGCDVGQAADVPSAQPNLEDSAD